MWPIERVYIVFNAGSSKHSISVRSQMGTVRHGQGQSGNQPPVVLHQRGRLGASYDRQAPRQLQGHALSRERHCSELLHHGVGGRDIWTPLALVVQERSPGLGRSYLAILPMLRSSLGSHRQIIRSVSAPLTLAIKLVAASPHRCGRPLEM